MNIDEIIRELESIVLTCKTNGNPHGLFAALYLEVTRQVKVGIMQKSFENPARMEQLDVVFAQRYLSAYRGWSNGEPVTQSWQVAFDAAAHHDLLVIQQLLVGINAHINLDLGIAAATVAPGAAIQHLQSDFNRINDILINMVDSVQGRISKISPLFVLLDWGLKRRDEAFAGFSLRTARTYAWECAQLLASLPTENWTLQIQKFDTWSAQLGQKITQRSGILGWVTKLIHYFEESDVQKQINVIEDAKTVIVVNNASLKS